MAHLAISTLMPPTVKLKLVVTNSIPPKRGFGQSAPQKKEAATKKQQELKSVVKEVEKEVKHRKRRLHIDPEVAAKGKVDFVQVESWDGGENPEDLEKLKLKSFSPSASSFGNDLPFYEQLVKRIQLLESKGDIAVVQPRKLPPFEKWKFGEKKYVQYLVDQRAVYRALGSAIEICAAIEDSVAIFNDKLGLNRSSAIEADLTAMQKESSLSTLPEPNTQTLAYVKYIEQLANPSPGQSEEKSREKRLRLLAHIFGVNVSHLSTGMRIGAKAVECLPVLSERKAFSFYHVYPEGVKDPIKVLIAAFNQVGHLITAEDDREEVMQELPRAIQKASLLLSSLAVVE
ncbi:hypothetical protein SELMODRAFT_413620 [Selaginella moellendorffii]|uniref:heme oxygenase (biliverdin-producing) n=1 Tax=Selaginella moellendorffii TaxID=88036 RepID=D8RQV5_SELML|nr:uncharacterized protein LOC9637897 [Selaginella moellendorffii]EFJ25712.1 hypothetical protein SELMODRAFT_413620 [Selaginella moellendorffii]|eukprot:XP_002973338.1 uncharacterized protein LOC9637897 [Selaginella moellendorffii]